MNLELNFVHNSDFYAGDYETALKGFNNAIRVRGDHAFAHYCVGLCHERLGRPEQAKMHLEIANSEAMTEFWWPFVRDLGVRIGNA